MRAVENGGEHAVFHAGDGLIAKINTYMLRKVLQGEMSETEVRAYVQTKNTTPKTE